ncbi:MAG: BREX-1 system phosphatase PglZ type A, partial [Chloroflexota bacterium]|nr:BREX-1 system phosphatase PglZ type A [Chloroflexota bacterium]
IKYVHGGAALQEVVLPVLHVHKTREDDVRKVDVEILRNGSSLISTGQLAVVFYQKQAVSPKMQARQLRAGLHTQSGELISNTEELTFDLSAENPRDREVKAQFVLSRKAEQANDQEVFLRLEEPVPNTRHYREYKSIRYTLRRSFTSDFDF